MTFDSGRLPPTSNYYNAACIQKIVNSVKEQIDNDHEDTKDLARELMDAMDFGERLQLELVLKKIRKKCEELLHDYDLHCEVDDLLIRRAIISAEPHIQKLSEPSAEPDLDKALEKGVRITLLRQWLIEKQGMRPFAAALRAVALDGNIPSDVSETR